MWVTVTECAASLKGQGGIAQCTNCLTRYSTASGALFRQHQTSFESIYINFIYYFKAGHKLQPAQALADDHMHAALLRRAPECELLSAAPITPA